MPVACALTRRGSTPPSTATSTATLRRMLVSLARFGGPRETGYQPGRPSFRFREPRNAAARPRRGRAGEDGHFRRGLEPDPTREDECLTTTDFPASLRERREVRTLELECGPAEQVQSRLGLGNAGAARRAGGGSGRWAPLGQKVGRNEPAGGEE